MPEEVTNSELARSLVRIESKLDRATEDHEARLRRVERFAYISIGLAAAGATSGVSALLSAMGG